MTSRRHRGELLVAVDEVHGDRLGGRQRRGRRLDGGRGLRRERARGRGARGGRLGQGSEGVRVDGSVGVVGRQPAAGQREPGQHEDPGGDAGQALIRGRRGARSTKREPPPGRSSTHARPPWRRACSATRASPRPVPMRWRAARAAGEALEDALLLARRARPGRRPRRGSAPVRRRPRRRSALVRRRAARRCSSRLAMARSRRRLSMGRDRSRQRW